MLHLDRVALTIVCLCSVPLYEILLIWALLLYTPQILQQMICY